MRASSRSWRAASYSAVVATCLISSTPVSAQAVSDPPVFRTPPPVAVDTRTFDGEERRPLLAETISRVLKDPTTYALPAVVYTAHRLDWDSSQKLFAYGYLERNPDFTLSGRVDDLPISHAAGKRKILRYSLQTIGHSILNNAASAVVERQLIDRYPQRRKLIRTLGWIERGLVTGYLSYRLTHNQFQQWQDNERTLRALRGQAATP